MMTAALLHYSLELGYRLLQVLFSIKKPDRINQEVVN
jgi:hypothetical protein